jgi:hypothetical protein
MARLAEDRYRPTTEDQDPAAKVCSVAETVLDTALLSWRNRPTADLDTGRRTGEHWSPLCDEFTGGVVIR